MRWWLVVGVAVALLGATSPVGLRAQTMADGHGSAHSPYAGQQTTSVRGLSAEEIQALRAGEGMGLARPAELNGYPGPRHVLDLADELALTAEQRAAVTHLFTQMQAEAVAAGERLLASYAALEQAFREDAITPALLDAHTAELGRLDGELRAVHLKYHLATRALLTSEQVAAYARLRGYDSAAAAPSGAPGHGH